MATESKDLKEQALQALTESDETQANAQQLASDLVRTFQASRDDGQWARALVEGTELRPETLKDLILVSNRQSDSARVAGHQMKEVLFLVSSSGNASSFATTTAAIDVTVASGSDRQPPASLQGLQRFSEIFKRGPLLDRLRAALSRCGLDQDHPDNRSVLALVQEAEAALAAPSSAVTSPTATLIALRGAILQTFAHLLRRYDGQEKTGRRWDAKLEAIQRRCGGNGVSSNHFKLLAEGAERIRDDLDDGKIVAMDRYEVGLRYVNGLQFLLGILDGVDEARLRP